MKYKNTHEINLALNFKLNALTFLVELLIMNSLIFTNTVYFKLKTKVLVKLKLLVYYINNYIFLKLNRN